MGWEGWSIEERVEMGVHKDGQSIRKQEKNEKVGHGLQWLRRKRERERMRSENQLTSC